MAGAGEQDPVTSLQDSHTRARPWTLTVVWLLVLACCCSPGVQAAVVGDTVIDSPALRSLTAGRFGTSDYPDYQSGVRYDEYPVVVPKRTALLLDKIMVALQKAVDEDSGVSSIPPDVPDATMDLQRRGQQKGRVYWRCYFNAVTCFKRK